LKSKRALFGQLDVEGRNSKCKRTKKVLVRQLIWENLGVLQQKELEPHAQLGNLKLTI